MLTTSFWPVAALKRVVSWVAVVAGAATDEVAGDRREREHGYEIDDVPHPLMVRPPDEGGNHPFGCARPQRRSLFASMSNHMANSVICSPAIRSTATRTIVAGVIALPAIRRASSTSPSTSPTPSMSTPKT